MAKKKKAKKKRRRKREPAPPPTGIAPTTGRPFPELNDKRGAKGRWLPGNCANPAGRGVQKPPLFEWLCKALKEIDPETELARGELMVQKFVLMALGATPKDQDKLRAICDILDRIMGKPTQRIEADVRRTSWADGIPASELEAIALGEAEPPEGWEDEGGE